MKTPNMIPGCIMLWYGAIANVPSGWHLCNGNMGTPDLMNNFVVGAGDTYDPDDTGGASTHLHVELYPAHNHNIPGGTDIAAGANWKNYVENKAVFFQTDFSDGRPPFKSLCYIMKIN